MYDYRTAFLPGLTKGAYGTRHSMSVDDGGIWRGRTIFSQQNGVKISRDDKRFRATFIEPEEGLGHIVGRDMPLVRWRAMAMARNKPSRLDIGIGGYMGASYSVALKRGALHHVTYGYGYVPEKKAVVRPTEEQWASFLAALDSLRVWRWRTRYEDPGVCDGTSWKVEITWGDKSIESSGCNSFPKAFGAYLEAVRALPGGLEFQ